MRQRPGLALREVAIGAIERWNERLADRPRYRYPWDDFEATLKQRGETFLRVLGYGSLVNYESASLTLDAKTLATRRAAVCFGVRRVFNYEMTKTVKRYGPPVDPASRAALNAVHTRDIDDVINGVVMEVALADVPALRAREVGYDLAPAPTLLWEDLSGLPFTTWVLCAPQEPTLGESHTNDQLSPHREYYRQCRQGAADIDADFLQLWLATTYLGDGITPVSQWEVDRKMD